MDPLSARRPHPACGGTGGRVSVHGRLHLIEVTLDEPWSRFCGDFGDQARQLPGCNAPAIEPAAMTVPNGPLPLLRLEAMRDGLEDYDYLYLAQRAQRDLREVEVSTPELEALAREITPYFAPGNGLVESLTQYSEDPQELESARERVARYVEKAQVLLQEL